MKDLGEVRPGSTIYVPFQTYDSNDPSASVTITGLAVTDIEIYKDGNVTQRASDSGYTLLDTDGIDFDGVTGIHGFSIDLADNTTAGFWAAGSQYTVVVASITVDAATINFIPVTFKIGYPNALINTTIATLSSQTSFTLTAGPAEDDALNGMWAIIHDVASAVQLGYAVVSDYVGSTRTVTLAAGTTFTAAATDNISIMGPAPLQPTVSGNRLDVTTTGAAGIDWGNVENQSTSVDLSATATNLVDTCTTNTDMRGTDSAYTGTPPTAAAIADQVWDEDLTGHTTASTSGERLGRVPNAAAGGNGGLPTVDANNYVAGVQGTLNTLDALDTAQDTQHSTTQSSIAGLNDLSAAQVNAECDTAISDASLATAAALAVVDGIVDDLKAAQILRTATAQAGAAGTITLDASASASDDFYNNTIISISAGTGAGQSRVISDYVGSTRVATVNGNWVTNPSSDSVFYIISFGAIPGASAPTAAAVADAVWDEAIADHNSAGTFGAKNQNLVPSETVGDYRATGFSTHSAADVWSVGTRVLTAGTNLNDISVSDILTTQMTEAYAADGTAPTLAQAIFLIQQSIGDFSISGTTLTVNRLDGSTPAATYTLDDDTNPTSRTRAS